MTTVIKAVYKNGVFKPVQHVSLSEQEKFFLLAIPLNEWKKQFSQLLKKIHQRTKKFSSSEIEKDISYTFAELQKNKSR